MNLPVETPSKGKRVGDFFRKAANEVPAIMAVVVAVLTTLATVADQVPDQTSVVGYVSAALLIFVRQFVMPAFPVGDKALDVANRADVRALEELARQGDETARLVLRRMEFPPQD